MANAVETEFRIAAPKLVPFMHQSRLACPGCGMGPNWWDRVLSSIRASSTSTTTIAYCGGGKAPTEVAGLAEALMHARAERFNPCAGVVEPHLHVVCRSCGYLRLMRTKEKVLAHG